VQFEEEEEESMMQKFITSIWMDRYGMFAAWLFFWQTLLSAVSSCFALAGFAWEVDALMNFVFCINYVWVFASFLYIFYCMDEPPVTSFIVGIFFYFLGFGTFIGVYWQWAAAAAAVGVLFKLGSFFFLAGSTLLMHGTWPGCKRRTLTSSAGASFWGSTCFTIGSVLFVAASWGVGPAAFVQAGLLIFTLGRVCFILGSQTDRCDMLFRRPVVKPKLKRSGTFGGNARLTKKASKHWSEIELPPVEEDVNEDDGEEKTEVASQENSTENDGDVLDAASPKSTTISATSHAGSSTCSI
jgi:hypothetical protein